MNYLDLLVNFFENISLHRFCTRVLIENITVFWWLPVFLFCWKVVRCSEKVGGGEKMGTVQLFGLNAASSDTLKPSQRNMGY